MSLEVFFSSRNDTRLRLRSFPLQTIWHPHSQIPEARAGILSAPVDCMCGIPGHATILPTRTRPPRLEPRPVATAGGGPARPTGSLRKPVAKQENGGDGSLAKTCKTTTEDTSVFKMKNVNCDNKEPNKMVIENTQNAND